MGMFIALMFIGLPLPFAMLFPAAIGILYIRTPAIAGQMLANEIFNTFTSYAFTVGPIFAMMGFFASYSGVGTNLFVAINAFLGHRRGGLAMATQVASAGFGAICGSPPASITTFAAIAYPEMRKLGYHPSLAGASVPAGAALSVLIPPSGTLIIYGIITENSIGRLFMAGIVPGVMLCVLNIFAIAWMCWRHPEWGPATHKHSRAEKIASLRKGGLIEIVIVFLISMGGMFMGVFTPTEAGAVGALGMLICTLVTRKMSRRSFVSAMMASVRTNAMLFLLLAGGQMLGKLFTVATIPQVIGRTIQGLDIPGWGIVIVIFVVFFLLGLVVDLLSIVIVTMPIFYPIVVNYLGYDPMWFGVALVYLISIGGITPPVGNGIFIMKGVINDEEATIGALFRGVWPFVIAAVAGLLVMLAFPPIVTALPDFYFGR
ncbi:MAG: TRAP transporter large permease [Clostridiales Family XIII bacterium]|jgi:tripartite ATP-independent transporter DctM subunit|nr:TRAP transporter large permease [Clostridiales Family XIII bacterium]